MFISIKGNQLTIQDFNGLKCFRLRDAEMLQVFIHTHSENQDMLCSSGVDHPNNWKLCAMFEWACTQAN